jgi:type IV pilus assembly protein PilM
MAWGLEIGAETLRLCRAEVQRGRLHLHQRAEVPVPPGMIRPSLKDGNIPDAAGLSRLLRDLCSRAGCRGWVRAALPDSVFSLRTVATDDLPAKRQEAQRFLRWQARDLLPFPVEEARLDFLPTAPGPDGRMRVVCLMARDRILTEYEGILADAGLRPAVLDASTISLAQAASGSLDHGTIGLLSVNGARSTFLLLQEGRPRFWRILPEGRGAWAGTDRARLLREVADSVTFCYESEGIPAAAGVLLGGLGPLTSEVASDLAEWLAVPITVLDLCAALRTEGHPDDLVNWGAAIGAAIRSC